MNKTLLVEHVASEAKLTKAQARAAVNAVLAGITDTVKQGTPVALTGFGTFSTRTAKARTGINPLTKERVQIPSRVVPTFRAGKGLKDAAATSMKK